MTTQRFSAVLFDCDGVLVDSEPITNAVLRVMLHELGWDLSEAECIRRFVGKSFLEEQEVIFEHTGYRIDANWITGFRARRDEVLRRQLEAVPGAADAVKAAAEVTGGRIACASGADRRKVEMQLTMAGLSETFGRFVFSGMELPRNKPAPDVYLAAAAALGVDPADAVVIEDSRSGVRAGIDAGATVFGFAPSGPTYLSADQLREAGASEVFTDMSDLPALLRST